MKKVSILMSNYRDDWTTDFIGVFESPEKAMERYPNFDWEYKEGRWQCKSCYVLEMPINSTLKELYANKGSE